MLLPETALEWFREAVGKVWILDGENTWPIDLNTVAHLFVDRFWEELHRHIDILRSRGCDERDIAARFISAARVIRLAMPCLLGMKRLGVPASGQRRALLDLLNLAASLKHGDLFNRDGANIVWSADQCYERLDPGKFTPADQASSRLFHRLCGLLWNYAEAVYFKVHGVVRDFHGPYPLPGDGAEVLVRDFTALAPGSLWDACNNIPFRDVLVAAVYPGAGLAVDFYGNVAMSGGSGYVAGLNRYFVEADGRLLSHAEIRRLSEMLGRGIIAVTGEVEVMTWRERVLKYADIFWYAKRELASAAGHDVAVPEDVALRIRRGRQDHRISSLGRDAMLRLLRIAL